MTGLLVWLLLGPRCALAEGQRAPSALDEALAYRDLLAVAQRGDREAALAALLRCTSTQVAEESRALAADADAAPARRKAAVLLHTEASLLTRYQPGRDRSPAHLRAAERLLSALARTRDEASRAEAREFQRLWLLALGYGYQDRCLGALAFETFETVAARFPTDPEGLVALGALVEEAAAAPAFFPVQLSRGVTWANAAGYYERALALRPDHMEARLRLAQAQTRRGRLDDARLNLQRVLTGQPPPTVAALAHLFLGEVEVREGRMPQAIESYRAALRADPRLQSAALALAAALQADGRPGQGASALLDALRSTRGEPVIGWYTYHTTLFRGYRSSMDALWQRVGP